MKKRTIKQKFANDFEEKQGILAVTSSTTLLLVASIVIFLLCLQLLQFFTQIGMAMEHSKTPKVVTIEDKQKRLDDIFHQEFLTEAAQGSVHHSSDHRMQRLSFDADLLFDWGIDTLTYNGRDILSRLVDVLHIAGDTYSRYEQVKVEAFPDLNKIASELSENDPVDSWELANARSDNVLDFLNIHAKTYFDTAIFTNTTYLHQDKTNKDLSKKQNRKIDFILIYAEHFKE